MQLPRPGSSGYAGIRSPTSVTSGDTLRIISFNVDLSEALQRVILVLPSDRQRRDVDVALLQ